MRQTLSSLCAAAIALFATRDARATNNWNQWDEDAASGVSRGATKLALGVDWAHVPDDHTLRFAVEGEHLLRDHWGIFGSAALPFEGPWVAPLLAGVRFHLLPKTPIDPFAGIAGGVAWMRIDGRDARVDPMVSAQVGAALYYFGLFFVQVEGRWDVARYSAAEGAIDRSGVVLDGKLGTYF